VNLTVTRTKTARTLVASVRVGGLEVESKSANLAIGAHDFKLVWTSFGGAVSLAVQLDGLPTPLLTVSGLETRFAGREAEGMGVSLFGTSTGNFKFEASFDDVSFSGDDHDDDDDDGFDDDDGDDDADEDGDSDGDDSTDAASFNAALDAITAASDLPYLEAETDFEAGVAVVKALQWNAIDGKLVLVVANSSSGAILSTSPWTPTADQLRKYQDEIDVLGAVVLSATDAVTQALVGYPGATVHSVELDEEEGAPEWKVEFITSAGVEREASISAD
jgi:uncharacterized membrane protein YkoI